MNDATSTTASAALQTIEETIQAQIDAGEIAPVLQIEANPAFGFRASLVGFEGIHLTAEGALIALARIIEEDRAF